MGLEREAGLPPRLLFQPHQGGWLVPAVMRSHGKVLS